MYKKLAKATGIAPFIGFLLVVSATVFCSGCISQAGVRKHDRRQAERILQARVEPGEVLVGVNLLALNTGFWATLNDVPGETLLRLGGDLVIGGATAWGGYLAGKQAGWWGDNAGNGNSSADGPRINSVIYNLSGNGNIIGNNNAVSGGDSGNRTDNSTAAVAP